MLTESELRKIWKDVMKTFGYPPLKDPVLSSDTQLVSTASFEMVNHKVHVNPDFVETLVAKGLDRLLVTKTLLLHEVAHYMICPFDFITLYKLIMEAYLRFHDIDRAKLIQNVYTDMVVNRHLYIEKDWTYISDMFSVETFDGYLGELLQEYYRLIYDLKVPENPQLKHKMVPFLKSELDENKKYDEKFKTFLDVFFDPQTMQDEDLNKPFGEDHEEGGSTLSHSFSLKAFSDHEIKDGKDQIQSQIPDTTYHKMIQQKILKQDAKAEPAGAQDSGSSGSSGNPSGCGGTAALPAYSYSLEHYEELLNSIRIKIEEKEIEANPESPYNSTYEDWTTDRNPMDVNIYASYGKLLPGLSKCFINSGETIAEDSGKRNMVLPDCVIAMDSSGSMINPSQQLSYALLGAFCTAREYLENNRSVGCVNFSDSTLVLDYSQDEAEIFSFLGHFQCGGTTLNTQAIKKLVENNENPVDIILISDMEIGNFQDTVDFLAGLENNNRTYIFKIEQSYSTAISNIPENVTLFSIKNPEDITSIIIKESAGWF